MWRLIRQDDNGNEFLVDIFPTWEEAKEEKDRLEAKKHKQLYWIEGD